MTKDQRLNQSVKRLVRSLGCSVWPEYGPCGNCPVQAGGKICLPNRKPVLYYFRARGTTVKMEFHKTFPILNDESFVYVEKTEGQYSAGWISEERCFDFIRNAIIAWKSAPPTKITHG